MPWEYVSDPTKAGPGYWYNTDTGQRGGPDQNKPPAGAVSSNGTAPIVVSGSNGAPDFSAPKTFTPAAQTTPNPGASGGSPSIFGTGQFGTTPYQINYGAITGNPSQGADTNYGLNDVWSGLQNAVNSLSVKNYAATAPTATAATGTAASGTAAQAQAAQGAASSYDAAQGSAASTLAASARAAQMRAAQGGFAQAGPTTISTAGDLGWQSQQQTLANILARQAAGGGVSPADLQLAQGRDQSIASQLAVLGSQRGGGNASLVARSAADQGAAAQAQMNQALGIQRAQETLNAQGALGSVLGTARGQAQNYNVNQANLSQGLNLANAGFAQQAGINNTNLLEQTGLANLGAAQETNALNANLAQSANQYNASNSQQMTLQNLLARNQASQFNAGNAQSMTLADMLAQNNMTSQNLTAQNQFGLQNVENSQQTGLANLANEQQTNLANLNVGARYGLANQNAAMNAQNQYNSQLLGLLGAQTGVGEANRSAALAANQLGVQQNTALNQIGAETFASAAQANQGLASALLAGGSSLVAAILSGAVKQSAGGEYTNSSTGYTTTDPQDPNLYQDSPTGDTSASGSGDSSGDYGEGGTGSDENMKTGIEGGNPMLQSFLEQYREYKNKSDPKIDTESGLSFHGPKYTKTYVPGGGGGGGGGGFLGPIGSVIGGAIGSAIAPGFGTAIGAGLGGAAAGAAQSQFAGGGGGGRMITQLSSEGGGIQPIDVTDDDAQALSDDQMKENVISGNRGMQAFLEQANAQQNAQNQQGAQNNAFMQTGNAPSAQVDRQLPPFARPGYQDTAGGYGAPQAYQPTSFGFGGYDWGGNLSSMGGYNRGGWDGAGITDQGSYQGGGMTQQAGVTQGATMQGATAGPPPPVQYRLPGVGTSANDALTTLLASGATALAPASSAVSSDTQGSPMYAGTAPLPGVTLPSPPPPRVAPPAPTVPVSLFSGPTTFVGRSDERDKSAVKDDPDSIRKMLDKLEAHQYRYKDPSAAGAGPGTYVSPMAQELEQTDLGKSFVRTGPDGHKLIDYGHALGTMLAGQAMLHHQQSDHDDRLSSLERLLRRTTAVRGPGENVNAA